LNCAKIALVRLSNKIVTLDFAPISEKVENHWTGDEYPTSVEARRAFLWPKRLGRKFPIWGTCTPKGAFAYLKGFI